jgi:hypothetical protein
LKPSKNFKKKIFIKWEIEKPINTHTQSVYNNTQFFFVHGQHQDVPGHLQTCLGQAIGQSGEKMLLYTLQKGPIAHFIIFPQIRV